MLGWSLGSVNLHSRLGPREVGGVPGMLWRTRILRDVLVFCKLLRKWCVYVYVCCLEFCLCASNAMLSLFGALRSQSLKLQNLNQALNSVFLEYVALIFAYRGQVAEMYVFKVVDVHMWILCSISKVS